MANKKQKTSVLKDTAMLAVAEALSHDIKSAIGTVGLKLTQAKAKNKRHSSNNERVDFGSFVDDTRTEIELIYDNAEAIKSAVRSGKMTSKKILSDSIYKELIGPTSIIYRSLNHFIKSSKFRTLEKFEPLRDARTATSRIQKVLEGLIVELDQDKEYEFELTNLRSHARNSVEQVAKIVKDSGAKISIIGTASIFADQAGILSLYTNLIENSIKYTQSNLDPIIQIKVSETPISELKERFPKLFENVNQPDQWAIIEVSDNGTGIPNSEKRKVFDIGYRGTQHKHISGSGVGLSRVKSAVRRHRGKYDLRDSEAGGIVFEAMLPSNPNLA